MRERRRKKKEERRKKKEERRKKKKMEKLGYFQKHEKYRYHIARLFILR